MAKLIRVESRVILGRPQEAIPEFLEAKALWAQSDPATRLRVLHCEALLLDALGSVRESEKLFRRTVKAFFDQEMYKQAFVTLLTLFECLVRRGALDKAAALCEEAIAATSQTGEACNEQIRRAWEELLATVRVRQLSEGELMQARQFLVRNWSVAAGTFLLPRVEASAVQPALPPEIPPPPPLPDTEASAPASFPEALEEYDRRLVAAALEKAGGNISEASRLLGMSRNTLKARMRQYGL